MKYLLSVILLLASGASHAENWVEMANTGDGVKSYVDFDHIDTNGKQITVWEKTTYAVPMKMFQGKFVYDLIRKKTYDCGTQKVADKYLVAYDRDANHLASVDHELDNSYEWRDIQAGTLADNIANHTETGLCLMVNHE
ncbi:MAG: hypothetical protein Q4E16_06930 [Neisseria sp.]|nr:hypothetical protein [Neisseria sp.]